MPRRTPRSIREFGRVRNRCCYCPQTAAPCRQAQAALRRYGAAPAARPAAARKQHDQQRPEIIQQPGFGRRREAQRQKIQRVVIRTARQLRRSMLSAVATRRGPHSAARSSSGIRQRADRKRHRRQLKGRIFPVATVNAASSDHIRIAVNPITVAVREVIGSSLRATGRR